MIGSRPMQWGSVARRIQYLAWLRPCIPSKITWSYQMRIQTLCTLLTKTFHRKQGLPLKNDFLGKATDLTLQSRCFWGLDLAFNKVDEERVRLAGPDRAAAEWILRNEGSLVWTNSDKYLKNYNFLPSTSFESYKIEEIDLTATSVIGIGFEHLENLKHVKSIKLHGCRTIADDALGHLHFVQDTLQHLEVSRCPMITEKGLGHLHCLKNLKTLVIYDLIEIKHFDKAIARLSQAMPWCKINTEDPLDKIDDSKEIT